MVMPPPHHTLYSCYYMDLPFLHTIVSLHNSLNRLQKKSSLNETPLLPVYALGP